VIDDAVDEIIETILDRGGDVVFVGHDTLGPRGPIALILR
jgi:hypothetical protein